MAVNIEYLKRKYFYKNKPVPYKLKCGEEIIIYPVMIEDSDIFEESYDILTFNKSEIPIPEIIQMSYLQFLIEIILREEQNKKEKERYNEHKLANILELCLKENNVIPNYSNGKPALFVCDEDDIVKSIITHKDFDDIKKIILYQNIKDYDDSYISKDMRNIIDEYYKATNSNIDPLSLEDKIAFLGNEAGLSTEEILKMTYREFNNRFGWAVDKMDYQINKTAEMSGNVKFDKKIEHLIYRRKKNKYEKFFTDKDAFTNKINNANA